MKYRRFGRTEIQIPVISTGGMRFQQSWKTGDPVSDDSQKNLEACIRRAFELGINHFETARGYGTSEEQLGKILPDLPRGEIIVQTKVGPSKDVKGFKETLDTSFGFLKVDYLDLFAFHGINDDESLEGALASLEVVRQYQKEGRIRHVGFSTHAYGDTIIKAVETGEFDYVNLHYYYIMQDNYCAVQAAHKQDMGVFIISPNDKGGMLYKENPKLEALTAPLHPMVFNDLFCLSHPEVCTLSCGVSKPDQFNIHLEAVEKLEQASELVAPMEQRLEAALAEAVGEEWAKTWREGLPSWEETPGHVNIRVILGLYNVAKAFGMTEFAKERYNLLGNAGPWFPGNKADKLDEFDLSESLRDSPHRDRIPGMLAEANELFLGEEVQRLQED